jgi:hypothetical protein
MAEEDVWRCTLTYLIPGEALIRVEGGHLLERLINGHSAEGGKFLKME